MLFIKTLRFCGCPGHTFQNIGLPFFGYASPKPVQPNTGFRSAFDKDQTLPRLPRLAVYQFMICSPVQNATPGFFFRAARTCSKYPIR